jgi:hypothetical protein
MNGVDAWQIGGQKTYGMARGKCRTTEEKNRQTETRVHGLKSNSCPQEMFRAWSAKCCFPSIILGCGFIIKLGNVARGEHRTQNPLLGFFFI